jgi:cell wall assembly regulator SMI1
LGQGLLTALEQRLLDHGAPVIEKLSAGLSDDEIDEALEPLGVQASVEARVWWSWHDGVPTDAVRTSDERSVGPGRDYLPLAEAVELYRTMRRIAEDSAESEAEQGVEERRTADWWWRPDWLPITTNGAGTTVACDCAVSTGAPSPVHAVNWGARETFYEPSAPSLGQVVTWWIEALDVGAWRYDGERGRWTYDWKLVDPTVQLTGLV